MKSTVSGDKILLETRLVAALVIPFLLVAFGILYFFPHNTENLFAWKIGPPMSAMMLGAAYAGGIYYFTGVLLAKQWHRIKAGILPVITFASLLGIATIMHWERFNHGSLPFLAWSGLYFTTPFIIFIVWLRNRPQDPIQPEKDDIILPSGVRLVIGVVGAITLIIALGLFLFPPLMISLWPWTLTPLTARVMGAMFSLPGVVGLGIAFDQRWSAARLILQSQGFSILLILIAVLRDLVDIKWTNPSAWLFAGGLAAMLVGIVVFYLFIETGTKTAYLEKANT
jgi:hypothetical protein